MTMQELEGATSAGDPWAYPAAAGEFAARWNAAPPEERERRVQGMVTASQRSARCFDYDHEGQLRWLQEQVMRLTAALDDAQPSYHVVKHPTRSLDDVSAIHDAHVDEEDHHRD